MATYEDIDLDVVDFEGCEEGYREPKRAKRRRVREQKIEYTKKWLKAERSRYKVKEPHRYLFLDPEDDEDMMFIWSLTDDDLKPFRGFRNEIVYYIEGYGVKNPPVPLIDWCGHEYTPDLPFLTDEDIDKSIRAEAVKIHNTPKQCNCDSCSNKRSYRGKKYGTRQERRARESFINIMEEFGYNPNPFVGKRITKGNGW